MPNKSVWHVTGNSSDFCAGSAAGGTCLHSGSRISTNTPGASIALYLPPNTSIVEIIGNVGSLSGSYTVTLAGEGGIETTTYNAWNPTFSTMQDNVLYCKTMYPGLRHSLSVVFVGEQGTSWQLWGVNYVIVNG